MLTPNKTPLTHARNNSRVLVTGAAGAVGSHLVDELLESGYTVVAVDRPGTELPPRPGLRFLEVDLSDLGAAARCVKDVDAVVHAAAVVDLAQPFEALCAINLLSVRALYEAAKQQQVGVFVFLSSGSVYAMGGAQPLTEEGPCQATSDYEQTKLWAEEYLRKQPPGGPRIAILRPALIFGGRSRVLGAALATLPALLGPLVRSLPRIEGGPRTNWVHARDVARAAAFLLESPQPSGSIWNVANDDPLSLGELVTLIFETAGATLSERRVAFPQRLMQLCGLIVKPPGVMGLVNRVLGWQWRRVCQAGGICSSLEPRLFAEAFAYLGTDAIFDTSKLKAAGFTLLYPRFADAWKETVDTYKEIGWLPPQPQKVDSWRFTETMAGQMQPEKAHLFAPPADFQFRVTASTADLFGVLMSTAAMKLQGVADLAGLATAQPLWGELFISPFIQRKLVYKVEFRSDHGTQLRFYGQKRIRPRQLLQSFTTLRGTVLEDGMPIGKATLRFDLRELPAWLRSFRFSHIPTRDQPIGNAGNPMGTTLISPAPDRLQPQRMTG